MHILAIFVSAIADLLDGYVPWFENCETVLVLPEPPLSYITSTFGGTSVFFRMKYNLCKFTLIETPTNHRWLCSGPAPTAPFVTATIAKSCQVPDYGGSSDSGRR